MQVLGGWLGGENERTCDDGEVLVEGDRERTITAGDAITEQGSVIWRSRS